jgi:hypothetical protein
MLASRIRRLAPLSLLLLGHGALHAEEPTAEAIGRISPALLRVEARDCGAAKPVAGTGFLWGSGDQAVTSLHVVAGCRNLLVYSEKLGRSVAASPTRVLLSADLALLHLAEALPLHPAELAPAPPALHEDLAVLGYSLGAPTAGDHLVRLAYGSSRLSDLLSSEVSQELQRNGTPALTLEVLRLDGVQVPGNSGAPVLNHDGQVVGVGDGGLEQGISSINWAVPAHFVAALPNSTDAMPTDTARTRESFAAELESEPGQSLRCGQLEFRKLRTRPFSRLRQTTDDPLALNQVLNSAGLAARILPQLAYDVWVNEASGAAVALPAGDAPQSEAGVCVVQEGPSLAVRFGGATVQSLADAQLRSTQFEQAAEAPAGRLSWQRDPQWSYAFPHINGLEGVVIQRNSGFGNNLMLGRATAYTSETLMVRGNVFVGIAVLTDQYNPQAVIACRAMPQNPACAPVQRALEGWLRAALGVLLSTFSAR